MSKILLVYVPVLHAGYRAFFERNADAEMLYILGPELVGELDHFRKDIRALNPSQVCSAVDSWDIFPAVRIATRKTLELIQKGESLVVLPDEEISHHLTGKYLAGCNFQFDQVFLRWDSKKSTAEETVRADRVISGPGFEKEIMIRAGSEAQRSSDWWRQVGALIVDRDGNIVIMVHNHHVPSHHIPYAFGDPRSNFKKGVHIELSTALHAEAAAVCVAAKREDISLLGASLFVTTFPCPPCAKLVAYSGVRCIYFREGYAMLDGESVLRANNIEIIQVK